MNCWDEIGAQMDGWMKEDGKGVSGRFKRGYGERGGGLLGNLTLH